MSDVEEIGKEAKLLDQKSIKERIKLNRSFFYKFICAIFLFSMFLIIIFFLLDGYSSFKLSWDLIFFAFLLETLDSAAGMGFGTGLAPILFLYGYSPLQIVPILLISETITGFIDAIFDHELRNVRFSFRPLNKTMKVTLLIASFGSLAIFISVFLSHFALKFPIFVIKIYVAILVLLMGFFALFRVFLKKIEEKKYNQKRLIVFAALAGFNKGIGGGGYGPVVTLGEIFSGIYEKSASAISSIAEGIVSLVGIFSFFFISNIGVEIDLILLPSIVSGGFFAAILSPYLVRVLPNKIWKIFIPIYAFTLSCYILISIFS